jgi:hypothetical protein
MLEGPSKLHRLEGIITHLYCKSFTIVIYDHNDSKIINYDCNDSSQYYKVLYFMILTRASLN